MNKRLRMALMLTVVLALTACGFHLRRDANLPSDMQKVYLSVSGNGDFQRALARAVAASDVTLVDELGPGVARLRVPQARFSVDALTVTGQGRISEKAVRFHVEFDAVDDHGKPIVAHQSVDMSREFTYDARNAIGQGSQTKALEQSMIEDMVRSVMFRLEAAGKHSAAAASTTPVSAASSAN